MPYPRARRPRSTAPRPRAARGGSRAHYSELVRVECAEALVRLHHEREEQRDHGGLDDDVGERERLHHRVDYRRALRDVRKDRRLAPVHVADREQQNVCGRLQNGEADHEVDEVAARDNPVEAGRKQPGGYRVGQEAHSSPPAPPPLPRSSSARSRNSVYASVNAPATSSPTEMLSSGMKPPESSIFGVPGSMKFFM